MKTSLQSLPQPPSDQPVLELLRMVSAVSSDIQGFVRGIEGYERLLQQCHPFHQKLKYDILGTAPNFRPFRTERDDDRVFKTLIDKDDTPMGGLGVGGVREPVYLEDVRSRAQRCGLRLRITVRACSPSLLAP